MKNFLTLVLMFMLFQLQAYCAILPEGTVVNIQPEKEIDADEIRQGDFVNFVVSRPVKVNGDTILRAGTEVKAQVTKRKNNFIFGVPGEIELNNFQINNADSIIHLRGTVINKGENRYWAHIGWFFLFPILFVKGDDGKIPMNSSYLLYTIEDINL